MQVKHELAVQVEHKVGHFEHDLSAELGKKPLGQF